MKHSVIIKDTVHNYIKVYEHEKCLVDTAPLQRLRRILQLPTSQYVYPSATHTRFSHSLGVMHVAGVFAESLYSEGIEESEKLRLYLISRLIGLLHDIGHGPFSHTFEDHILINYGLNHEVLGSKILRESPEIVKCFEKHIEKEFNVTLEQISKSIEAPVIEAWPLHSKVGEYRESSLYYIIKGPYSADIVDYLLRDSYHTGANYGLGLDWTRLAYHSKAVGDTIALEYKARDVLDHLLFARLYMFKTVYYHKTSRAFDKVLGNILQKVEHILKIPEAIEKPDLYIELDDDYILANPEVRKLEETRYILRREVPYKLVYEIIQPLEKISAALIKIGKSLIEKIIGEAFIELTGVSDPTAVFVDSPRLPTNPMFEEAEINILKPDGSIVRTPIRETIAGIMPHEVSFFRIYLHREYIEHLDKLRTQVASLFGSSVELRPFY
ncbi:MAG: HD domain-containing protein [Sulfolobales archaeon]|nr:HD domain-containing protein [Sulfolobales archaeon]MDW8083472.1 HD domain-containing protein [Sulfolobales archaeon]